MADLLDPLARYLAGRGLGVYDPDGPGGDIALETLPQAPDEVVLLTQYGGDSDPLNAFDEPRIQVKVRGTGDRRVSYDRAHDIHHELHGLTGIELPGGIWLVHALANQTPASLGVDENGRHLHVVNFRLGVSSPSLHRP